MHIVAIVGPTAAGKSDLAMSLAERFEGEIICADSRTLFRGMNIGTAKPSGRGSQARAAPYARYSGSRPTGERCRVQNTGARGGGGSGRSWQIAFLVGGSGLYVYSVLYDFQFPAGPRTAAREELEQRTLDEAGEQAARD